MTARANRAEGGADGVKVTPANSGGTSGDAFNYADAPAGCSVTFATAAAYKGSRGYRITLDSSSSWGGYLRWTVTGWPIVRARFYLRTTAYPTATAIVAGVGAFGASTYTAMVKLDTGGRLQLVDYANQVLWSSSAALPLNTWIRVEFIAKPGATTNTGVLRLGYGLADAALSDSFASTTANVGPTGTVDNLYIGKLAGVWATTADVDDLAADDQSETTFLGPTSVSAPVVTDPALPPSAVLAWPPPAPYSEAIRSSLAIWYTVDAFYRGVPVPGATDLRPVGGSITDTTKPGVRRMLTLELAPTPGLYDLLTPIGTVLAVTARVQYTDQRVQDVPMGAFVVDSVKASAAGGALSLTAPDKWSYIQRARFVGPAPSTAGTLVREQLALLIKDAISPSEPVNITATSDAVMPLVVWEKDRDKALNDLAKSIGAWVYFDRRGVATVADVPTGSTSIVWPLDGTGDGVLVDVDRERSRDTTYNVVVVSSSATDGEKFPVTYVWDDDPSSPTYAGTTVPFASGTPFGIVPYYYDTPILSTVAAARQAGMTILQRVTGLSSQVSLESVPNPAIDAFDALDVTVPAETWSGPVRLERHVVDTVTHPLVLGQAQHIDGRVPGTDDVGSN